MSRRIARIDSFDFRPGRMLGGKYRIEELLGSGWEGEVYRITEVRTGIRRAAKVFFPHRNVRDRAARFYARKLEQLRRCSIVIQYHHSEVLRHRGTPITFLISDFVEGELLEDLVARQPGGRLGTFEALHLLQALASGMEEIHLLREYHGDIHDRNVLVQRRGIRFEIQLLDFYQWGRADRAKIREDVIQMVRLLYDSVGGAGRYANQPPEIKSICKGLRRDLIARSFPTAGHLRRHLESFNWEE